MATVCSADVSSAELELIRHLPARRGRYRAFLDSLAGFQPAEQKERARCPFVTNCKGAGLNYRENQCPIRKKISLLTFRAN